LAGTRAGAPATPRRERFFHWELEFPGVILGADRRGFDAVLGYSPWDKVLRTKQGSGALE